MPRSSRGSPAGAGRASHAGRAFPGLSEKRDAMPSSDRVLSLVEIGKAKLGSLRLVCRTQVNDGAFSAFILLAPLAPHGSC